MDDQIILLSSSAYNRTSILPSSESGASAIPINDSVAIFLVFCYIVFMPIALVCYVGFTSYGASFILISFSSRRRQNHLIEQHRKRMKMIDQDLISKRVLRHGLSQTLITQCQKYAQDTSKCIDASFYDNESNDESHESDKSIKQSLVATSVDDDCICVICMEGYNVGEDVSWSRHNEQCNHVYHRKCIVSWLAQHDECPCCRQRYINVNNNSIITDMRWRVFHPCGGEKKVHAIHDRSMRQFCVKHGLVMLEQNEKNEAILV